jgi:hypothetical protein
VLLADYDDVEQLMTSFEMSIMADPIDVFTDLLEEVPMRISQMRSRYISPVSLPLSYPLSRSTS